MAGGVCNTLQTVVIISSALSAFHAAVIYEKEREKERERERKIERKDRDRQLLKHSVQQQNQINRY